MISIKINGLDFLSKPSISVLEACKNIGITIPRFCYHEMLSISGNCRMCLVEIEGMEKPVASCVTEVEENMSIRVDSPFVKKARENVVEALLLNHPLDCPICDQAGECDLQDQTKTFGSTHSRYFFAKKATEDKYCGPLIKTIMTRCIKCTRCVRYAEEVTGVNYFGTLNRGVETEIGSYVTKMYESEISGNVVDLCPVGALTSKPYAFKARPWELRLVESFDTTDSLGSNIYVNYKESEILRVLPKNNADINESIISDKARYSYDSNNLNRIKNVYQYSIAEKKFLNKSWKDLFNNLGDKLEEKPISVLLNQEIDLESAISLKSIKNRHGNKFSINDSDSISKQSNVYIANQTNISHTLEKLDDLSIFLGTNLRFENSLLNARIRFKSRNSYHSNYVVGNTFDSNLPSHFVNLNMQNVISVFEGRCFLLSKLIHNSAKPFVFVGNSFANRISNIGNFTEYLKNFFNNMSLVFSHSSCNSDGLKWLNVKRTNNPGTAALLNINMRTNFLANKTVNCSLNKEMFLSTHGSGNVVGFNTILPITTPFESEYSFLNLEHRPQKTAASINVVSEGRNLNSTLNAIFNNSESIADKKWYSHIIEGINSPEKYSSVKGAKFINSIIKNNSGIKTKLSKYPIKVYIKDFYLSSRQSSSSKIMRDCSKETHFNFSNFTSF